MRNHRRRTVRGPHMAHVQPQVMRVNAAARLYLCLQQQQQQTPLPRCAGARSKPNRDRRKVAGVGREPTESALRVRFERAL